MARPLALLALGVFVSACAGSPPTPADDAKRAVQAVWLGLDEAAARFAARGSEAGADPVATCDGPFGTWFVHFGVRGLACTAAQVADPASVVALAPAAPFESGPHAAAAGAVDLDLASPRAFGHYDPAFVRWAWAAAVPEGTAGRAMVAPAYRRHVARLARIYWLAHADLVASGFPDRTPPGPLSDYAAFLDGGPAGADGPGFSVSAFADRSRALLPDVGLAVPNEWAATYEANTAYGFWLRRRADGTLADWHGGLRDLLSTFDADWLAGQ